jgi:H+/Cl- antiporter ClcA
LPESRSSCWCAARRPAGFSLPADDLANPLLETPLYVLIGLVAALFGAVVAQAVFLSERLQALLSLPPARKAVTKPDPIRLLKQRW